MCVCYFEKVATGSKLRVGVQGNWLQLYIRITTVHVKWNIQILAPAWLTFTCVYRMRTDWFCDEKLTVHKLFLSDDEEQETQQRPCIAALENVTKNMTPAQKFWASVLVKGVPMFGPKYMPTCDKEGYYAPMQCFRHKNECWCVDRLGNEIKNSRDKRTRGKRNKLECSWRRKSQGFTLHVSLCMYFSVLLDSNKVMDKIWLCRINIWVWKVKQQQQILNLHDSDVHERI